MKKALGYFWYIFFLLSWLVIVLIRAGLVAPELNSAVFITGALFYALKLRYINDIIFRDLNYWTIAYYLVFYLCFVFVGIGVWATIYFMFKYSDLEFFKKLFPTDIAFYIPSSRMILAGSSFCISGMITAGMHRHHRPLRFTNNVPLLEIVFVFVALTWVLMDWSFIGLFNSVIIISTAPEFVKNLIGAFLSFILRREVTLIGRNIENNRDDDWVVTRREEYWAEAKEAIFTVLVSGWWVHLKFACLILLIGGPYVLFIGGWL